MVYSNGCNLMTCRKNGFKLMNVDERGDRLKLFVIVVVVIIIIITMMMLCQSLVKILIFICKKKEK